MLRFVSTNKTIYEMMLVFSTKKNSTAIYMGAKIIDIMSGRAAANVFCRMLRNVKYVSYRKRCTQMYECDEVLVMFVYWFGYLYLRVLPVRKKKRISN